jgi:hypothetical protein
MDMDIDVDTSAITGKFLDPPLGISTSYLIFHFFQTKFSLASANTSTTEIR